MVLLIFFAFWAYVLWSAYFYLTYRPRSVQGKTVLITGGGSGIGRLMAIKFAKLGANIILWDVNAAGMNEVTETIQAAGGRCQNFTVDVTKREVVYQTAKQCGDVDVLINNAGIVSGKSIMDCPDELMQKTVEVNTISHFWTIKAFLPAMMKKDEGHIVTIASAAGTCGVAGLVDYCASKFGAVGTAEALYMELKKKKSKVQSTCIMPYYIDTGMFDGVTTKFPLLLPILKPEPTADRIVKAVLRGEEALCLPWMVNTGFIAKVLPVPWQLWIANFLGLSDGMDNFKGHGSKTNSKNKKA